MKEYGGKDLQKVEDDNDVGKERVVVVVQLRLSDAPSPLPITRSRWKALGGEGVALGILE